MEEPTRASILSLPVELRLNIYEIAFEILPVKLYGRADGQKAISKSITGPVVLLHLNRLIRREALSVKPSISDLQFELNDFTVADVKDWVEYIGDSNVAKIQRLQINLYSGCYWGNQWHRGHYRSCKYQRGGPCSDHCEKFHDTIDGLKRTYGLCRRSLSLDLRTSCIKEAQSAFSTDIFGYWKEHAQAKLCEHEFGGSGGEPWGTMHGRCASRHFFTIPWTFPGPGDPLSKLGVLRILSRMKGDHARWDVHELWNAYIEEGVLQEVAKREGTDHDQAIALLPEVRPNSSTLAKNDVSSWLRVVWMSCKQKFTSVT